MKVKRLKCIKDLDGFYFNERIFVEYGTIPGFFYPVDEENPVGVGFCIEFLKRKKIDTILLKLIL